MNWFEFGAGELEVERFFLASVNVPTLERLAVGGRGG